MLCWLGWESGRLGEVGGSMLCLCFMIYSHGGLKEAVRRSLGGLSYCCIVMYLENEKREMGNTR